MPWALLAVNDEILQMTEWFKNRPLSEIILKKTLDMLS